MEQTAEKVKYGSFLRDKVVAIKPVESSGRWANLLAKGQDMKNSPFMFNKVKRSFQLPLNSERNGGGVKVILDDNVRVKIEKYIDSYPEGMTEKKFFEKEIGVDLTPSNKREDNFWRTDKRGRVTLTKEGATFNLALPMDMLKYKILLANPTLIASSFETRKDKQTYEFMVVDENKVTNEKVKEAGIKAEAWAKYAKVTRNSESMKGFIRAIGRTIPASYSEDWLKSEILTVLENGEKNFLNIVNDDDYNMKIVVQKAVEVGALRKLNNNRFTLDNGIELGDLPQVIVWLKDPKNQEVKLRIKSQIEMAKK